MRAIEEYDGQATTHAALRLAPYHPVSCVLRNGRKSTFERSEWRIPGERMKMGEMHIVPLARQAVRIFCELEPRTEGGRYVFPAIGKRDRPLSENTLNAALRRLGYAKKERTAHGFRSIASTLLNEQGWHRNLIAMQLAHKERSNVRVAYTPAQRFKEHRNFRRPRSSLLAQF